MNRVYAGKMYLIKYAGQEVEGELLHICKGLNLYSFKFICPFTNEQIYNTFLKSDIKKKIK